MKNILVAVAVLFLQNYCFAQNEAARIDTLLNAYTNLNQFNGSALVAAKGKILLNKGYGYRDAATGVLNDEHSIFRPALHGVIATVAILCSATLLKK